MLEERDDATSDLSLLIGYLEDNRLNFRHEELSRWGHQKSLYSRLVGQ